MEIDSENNLLSRGLNERQFGPSDDFGVIYTIGQTNWKVEGAVECKMNYYFHEFYHRIQFYLSDSVMEITFVFMFFS